MDPNAEVVALCSNVITRARYVRQHRWPVAAASDALDGLLTAVADPENPVAWGRIRRLVDEVRELPSTAVVELRLLGEHLSSCPTCLPSDPVRLWHGLTHVFLWGGRIEDAAYMAVARQQQLDSTESSRTSVLIAELDGLAVGRFGLEPPIVPPYTIAAVMDQTQQLNDLLATSAIDPHVIDDIAWLWSLCLDEEAGKGGTLAWYREQRARFQGPPLERTPPNFHQRVAELSRSEQRQQGRTGCGSC